MKYPCFLLIAVVLLCCKPGSEETQVHTPVLQSEEVTYSADSVNFRGWMVWDSTIHEKRPGVIVVHEWWGHNDYTRQRARMLAELGYTAFAIDMFGDGKTAEHPDSAMAYIQQALSTADGGKGRFNEALKILRNHATVASDEIAAIGYCFGGTVVLEMARAGTDLDGVVSFHGGLGTDNPAAPGQVRAEVLVCTGGADPMIPKESVEAFETEMKAANVKYKVITYPDALHAFTNPAADSLGKAFSLPVKYDMNADTSSWRSAKQFLASVLQ